MFSAITSSLHLLQGSNDLPHLYLLVTKVVNAPSVH